VFNVEEYLNTVHELRDLYDEVWEKTKDGIWSESAEDSVWEIERPLYGLLRDLKSFGEMLFELRCLREAAPDVARKIIEYRDVLNDYKDGLAELQQAIREAQHDQEKQIA